jgi:hypothetical protein
MVAGLAAGTLGGSVGHVMAEIIWSMRVVSTQGLLLAALYVPAVVGSMITGAALVRLLRDRGTAGAPTVPVVPAPSVAAAKYFPLSDHDARAKKRREILPRLPLIVPVEPRAWVVLALAGTICLMWMLVAVLAAMAVAFLPPFTAIARGREALTPIVWVAILGAVGGFVLSMVVFRTPLTWIARSGTLTIDEWGLSLRVGERDEAISWRGPIRVRRWNAGLVTADADVYEGMYEAWELEQGSAQLTISRRGKKMRRRLLSHYAASGQRLPTTERGILVPLKARLVFEAIASLADLRLVEDVEQE